MLRGCFTALVTPFTNGEIDEKALRSLVEFQIEGGVDGIVPCGTTGESATLTHDEHRRVIDIVIETVAGRVKVIAGSGSNATAESVELTKYVQKAGADAALVITPYYNKPTQAGLLEHYRRIAGETSIPIVLYNVPGRTSVDMTAETVARLSEIENIIAVKEATGSLARTSDILEYSRDGFIVLSGDDFVTYPMLTIGAKGVISVTSNVAPADMSEMCRAFFEDRSNDARALHYKLQPLHRAMFLETNPIPVKTALAEMGKIGEQFRLPLVQMGDDTRKKLLAELKSYGLV